MGGSAGAGLGAAGLELLAVVTLVSPLASRPNIALTVTAWAGTGKAHISTILAH